MGKLSVERHLSSWPAPALQLSSLSLFSPGGGATPNLLVASFALLFGDLQWFLLSPLAWETTKNLGFFSCSVLLRLTFMIMKTSYKSSQAHFRYFLSSWICKNSHPTQLFTFKCQNNSVIIRGEGSAGQWYNNVWSQRSISRCAWPGLTGCGSCSLASSFSWRHTVQFQDEIEQEMIWMIDVIHYDQHLVSKVDFQGWIITKTMPIICLEISNR